MNPIELKFKRDTKLRKKYFAPESFAHPAKMHLQMLLWIMGKYTKPNEIILDPMAGSGTTMLATLYGRHVILVELEEKFVKMCQDNWVKLVSEGYTIGTCQIIQGDARNLTGILADKIITSPPYSDSPIGGGLNIKPPREGHNDQSGRSLHSSSQIGAGQYDKIITSPPYENQIHRGSGEWSQSPDGRMVGVPQGEDYTKSDNNVANLSYGSIDAVISSPPYEEAMGKKHHSRRADKLAKEKSNPVTYTDKVDSETSNNIGNLKSDSYLSAMLQVYQQCYQVLKDDGLMILVTKDFIRNKQRIYLSMDTVALCQQTGFELIDWHYRKLLSQSFWRILYHRKYPEVPMIEREDILVFKK